MEKKAVISDCQKYRYSLERVWDSSKPSIGFIGLNPSTADAFIDDPTIRRCIQFAKDWGGGGIYMVNLFAFRATSPKDMLSQTDPIGQENDQHLLKMASQVSKIIACWGNDGGHQNRANNVKVLLNCEMACFAINKGGEPKHPLYVKGSTELILFNKLIQVNQRGLE